MIGLDDAIKEYWVNFGEDEEEIAYENESDLKDNKAKKMIPYDEEICEVLEVIEKQGQKEQAKREQLKEIAQKVGINLPELEELIRKMVYIRKIAGRLRYYDGKCYCCLDSNIFCGLCKKYFPQDILKQLFSLKILKSLYQYISCEYEVGVEEEYFDSSYISFVNGVLDIDELKFHAHSAEFETPYCINASYIKGGYENMENFERLIYQMTGGDEECEELIWEMLGYLLLHVTPKRVFFWLGTEPATGKSLLGDFIVRLFGMSNCSQISANGIGGRFNLAQFVQCSINLGMESSGKLSQMDVLRIKELTGNKTISIERKGMDRVDYPNYSTLVFASNDAINIGDFDDTGAFWERCKFIPCMHSCPLEQRDPYLLEKIWGERDFIVSKAARYAKRLMENNFIFTEPKLAIEMKEMWKAAYENPVKAFIRERIKFVLVGSQQDSFIPTEKLYEEFVVFSEKNMSIESFSKEFRKFTLGQAQKTKRRCAGYNSSVNGFLGVKIKERVE
ncbi:MAG: hypothetical protein IJN64_17650 [Lachnospiraceae bacterium]|nr:hypothetical protein [Lachnospiraceae bacterium]